MIRAIVPFLLLFAAAQASDPFIGTREEVRAADREKVISDTVMTVIVRDEHATAATPSAGPVGEVLQQAFTPWCPTRTSLVAVSPGPVECDQPLNRNIQGRLSCSIRYEQVCKRNTLGSFPGDGVKLKTLLQGGTGATQAEAIDFIEKWGPENIGCPYKSEQTHLERGEVSCIQSEGQWHCWAGYRATCQYSG